MCFWSGKHGRGLLSQMVCVGRGLVPQMVCVGRGLVPQMVCVGRGLVPQMVCANLGWEMWCCLIENTEPLKLHGISSIKLQLFHLIVLNCVELHCIQLHRITLHHVSKHSLILHSIALHCIALHCIALHCIALHCIALHCIALYYIASCLNTLLYITLHYIALHCIALHCIALHCIALHCIALHCIALHCIALHVGSLISVVPDVLIWSHTRTASNCLRPGESISWPLDNLYFHPLEVVSRNIKPTFRQHWLKLSCLLGMQTIETECVMLSSSSFVQSSQAALAELCKFIQLQRRQNTMLCTLQWKPLWLLH